MQMTSAVVSWCLGNSLFMWVKCVRLWVMFTVLQAQNVEERASRFNNSQSQRSKMSSDVMSSCFITLMPFDSHHSYFRTSWFLGSQWLKDLHPVTVSSASPQSFPVILITVVVTSWRKASAHTPTFSESPWICDELSYDRTQSLQHAFVHNTTTSLQIPAR